MISLHASFDGDINNPVSVFESACKSERNLKNAKIIFLRSSVFTNLVNRKVCKKVFLSWV